MSKTAGIVLGTIITCVLVLSFMIYREKAHQENEMQRWRERSAAVERCGKLSAEKVDDCLANLPKLDEEVAEAWSNRTPAEKPESPERICSRVYRRTIDKALGELTVREKQLIEACTVAGLYREAP